MQMLVLLVVVAIGYVANRCNLMGGDFDKRLSAFIIDISCPLLILSSVMGDTLPDRSLILPLLLVSFATYGLLLLMAISVSRLLGRNDVERGMYSFMVMFANVGFLGYPVVASIFGHEAVFYAALLNVPNTLFVFVFGVSFVKGGAFTLKNFDKKLLLSPAMLASYLSIAIVVLGINGVPRFIAEPIHLVGSMTVPGALLIIGSSMAGVDLRGAFTSWRVWTLAVVRLCIVPLAMYFIFKCLGQLLPIDDIIVAINAVVVGMPVASYGTMFCLRYGRDDTLMVQATMLTTLLSAITIPVLTLLF